MKRVTLLLSLFIYSVVSLNAVGTINDSDSSNGYGEHIFYLDDCAIKISPVAYYEQFNIEIMPYFNYQNWLDGNNDVYSYSMMVWNEPNGPWSPCDDHIIDKTQPITVVDDYVGPWKFKLELFKNGNSQGTVILTSMQ